MKQIGIYLILAGFFFLILHFLYNLIFKVKAAKEELSDLKTGKASPPKRAAAAISHAKPQVDYETMLLETESFEAAEGEYKTSLL